MKELSLDYVTELIMKSGKLAGLEYIVHEFMDAYDLQVTNSGEKKFSEWLIEYERETNALFSEEQADDEIAGFLIMNSVIDPSGFFAKLRKAIIVMGMRFTGSDEKDIESVLNELPY